MFYRVAAIDDEAQVLDELQNLMEKYASERGVEIMCDRYSDGLDLRASRTDVYDVIFLDIEMEHSNGFESAKALREEGFAAAIVFVTNLTAYAVAGYSVAAMDYVVKPVTYARLSAVLDRVFKAVNKKKGEASLDLTVGGETKRIPLNHIMYAESMGHQITVHTTETDEVMWSTLSQLEQQLPADAFVRITSSYIVNLAFVDAVRGNDIYLRGTEVILPIRKGGKKEFMAALNKYLGG